MKASPEVKMELRREATSKNPPRASFSRPVIHYDADRCPGAACWRPFFALLAARPRRLLETTLHRQAGRGSGSVPLLLTAVFAGAAALVGVYSAPLTLMVAAYTAAPVLCAYAQGVGPAARPSALDFATSPVALAAAGIRGGREPDSQASPGFLHSVAYMASRSCWDWFCSPVPVVPRPKIQRAAQLAGLLAAAGGFAIVAPVLAGDEESPVGFIRRPHSPLQSAGRMIGAAGIISRGRRCRRRFCSLADSEPARPALRRIERVHC